MLSESLFNRGFLSCFKFILFNQTHTVLNNHHNQKVFSDTKNLNDNDFKTEFDTTFMWRKSIATWHLQLFTSYCLQPHSVLLWTH